MSVSGPGLRAAGWEQRGAAGRCALFGPGGGARGDLAAARRTLLRDRIPALRVGTSV